MGFFGEWLDWLSVTRQCQSVYLTWMRSDEHEDSYQKIYENDNFEEHKANFGQELVAGGAAFAGFKAFEDHQRKEGMSRAARCMNR